MNHRLLSLLSILLIVSSIAVASGLKGMPRLRTPLERRRTNLMQVNRLTFRQFSPNKILDSAGFSSWQWQNPLPQGNPIEGLLMTDPNTIYAEAYGGTFMKTINDGKTWYIRTDVKDLEGLGGMFHDTDVVVYGNKVLRTIDGGNSWNDVTPGAFTTIRQLTFAGTRFGWLLADTEFTMQFGSLLYQTTDAGASWKSVYYSGHSQFAIGLFQVAFFDSLHGKALAGNASDGTWLGIVGTTNGGRNWTGEYSFPVNLSIFNFQFFPQFIDRTHGKVLGNFAGLGHAPQWNIIYTVDGGNNWNTQHLPDSLTPSIPRMFFIDSTFGFVSDFYSDGNLRKTKVYRTIDGGFTWTRCQDFDDFAILSFCSRSTGIARDGGSRIMQTVDSGKTWSPITSGYADIDPGSILGSVFFLNDHEGFTGSYGGNLFLHTTDRGMHWNSYKRYSTPDSILFISSIWFTDTLHGFVCDQNYHGLFETTDGGASWFQSTDASDIFNTVAFSNSRRGTAVGNSGTIMSTTDGGMTWSDQSYTGESFWGVFFTDSLSGYAVGSSIYHTGDGGVTWQKQGDASNVGFGVCFPTATTGIIVGGGTGSDILRTTDGGATWSPVRNPNPVKFTGLWSVTFTDPERGFISDIFGGILQTSDGGLTWKDANSPVNSLDGWGLYDIQAVKQPAGGSMVFATGGGGTILCTTVSPLPGRTWAGVIDSSWNNPANWAPEGIPTPDDSIIIGSSAHNPVVNIVQQQIMVASLTILPGGHLSLTDSLPRFVVLGDVFIGGTLELRPPAPTSMIVGGNWTVQPGGNASPLKGTVQPVFSDQGFLPGNSTISFTGSGKVASKFYNVLFDKGSTMASSGNIVVDNSCTIYDGVTLQLRHTDTLFIRGANALARNGSGIVANGTVERVIGSARNQRYCFTSDSTYVQFSSVGVTPGKVSMTVFPNTLPPFSQGSWVMASSVVDTVTHTISADGITHFSKWAIAIPRPSRKNSGELALVPDSSTALRRYFIISTDRDSQFTARISFQYPDSEIPPGVDERGFRFFTDSLGHTDGVNNTLLILPSEYLLAQNYPNPFNPATQISFDLPEASTVTLAVYNVLGQEVARIVNDQTYSPGRHSVNFDASHIASGVYFYRLSANGMRNTGRRFNSQKKMMVVR